MANAVGLFYTYEGMMMTKQELLTKLATECATWEEAMDAVVLLACGSGRRCASYGIAKQDWLAERERLLNKPSWSQGVTWRAMNKDGQWLVSNFELPINGNGWSMSYGIGRFVESATRAIAIPAGYDWKESLEERPV